jgi:hypothetical protein
MHPARSFWQAYEPLHAIGYFHPAFKEDMAARGLTGGWNDYFAARSAPLGEVPPSAVTALFFGFAPARVERALPKVWGRITPDVAITSRLETASAVLEPAVAVVDRGDLERAVDALERAADDAAYDGRALGAAWASVPRPDDLLSRLWLVTAVLREHRGDGHVLACVHAGLTGLDASVTHVGTGATGRDIVQGSRGWADEEWEASLDGLRSRGLVVADGETLTDEGRALRERVEDDTDRLASSPLTTLGDDAEAVAATLRTVARDVVDRGWVGMPNPMGLPRP